MLQTNLIAPVPELLRCHADSRGEKVAFKDDNSSITYGALFEATANLSGHLRELGVGPGESVAILLPNSVEWVVSCLSIIRAGGIVVPISYESTEGDVLYRIDDASCRIVITTDECAGLIEELKTDLPSLAEMVLVERGEKRSEGVRFSDLVTRKPNEAPLDSEDIHSPAYIIYTSGTTGRAKGVLLTTHGMLWVTASCWAPITGLSENDTVLSPLPLFHSYALNLSVLSVLAVGATEHIMERFSTDRALALLGTGAFTVFPGVPTMFHYLLQRAQEEPDFECSSLRVCLSAGAIMPATLNAEFEAYFGVTLLDGYGITETSTMVTMNWPVGDRVMGSCGLPVPGLSTRIIDPATGDDVPIGEEGELIVRGPNVMPGYHNKPNETEAALKNGWYFTGDLARSDANGYLTITGRLKELIIRGGQNIAPAEIEEAVVKFDGVVDSAVVGQAHEHLGEVPVVFIVEEQGETVNDDALLEHCRALLVAYKVPVAVHRIDEIPRTGSGKTIRFKLSELLGDA